MKETWQQYLRSDVTFLLASILTQVAFCLLKCSDDAFVALNPDLATHFEPLAFLGFKVLHVLNEGGPAIVEASSDIPVTPELSELLFFEWSCSLANPQCEIAILHGEGAQNERRTSERLIRRNGLPARSSLQHHGYLVSEKRSWYRSIFGGHGQSSYSPADVAGRCKRHVR